MKARYGFTLKLETGNEAFSAVGEETDAQARKAEIARILRKVAETLEEGPHTIKDYNGNRVGFYDLKGA